MDQKITAGVLTIQQRVRAQVASSNPIVQYGMGRRGYPRVTLAVSFTASWIDGAWRAPDMTTLEVADVLTSGSTGAPYDARYSPKFDGRDERIDALIQAAMPTTTITIQEDQ